MFPDLLPFLFSREMILNGRLEKQIKGKKSFRLPLLQVQLVIATFHCGLGKCKIFVFLFCTLFNQVLLLFTA